MGGEKETTVEKKAPKDKGDKANIGAFRIHENNGEVHIHDDANKLKVAMPISAWWKMWEQLRNEPGARKWPDPVNKTEIVVETTLDNAFLDVSISVTPIKVSADWEKLNTFSKRK